MIPARISLVTLGVRDVARSKAFYSALGWEAAIDMDDFAVFRTAGSLLAVYPETDLARDMTALSLRIAGRALFGVDLQAGF